MASVGEGGRDLTYVTAESAEGNEPVSLGTKFIRAAKYSISNSQETHHLFQRLECVDSIGLSSQTNPIIEIQKHLQNYLNVLLEWLRL
jgi:hypothetical protein